MAGGGCDLCLSGACCAQKEPGDKSSGLEPRSAHDTIRFVQTFLLVVRAAVSGLTRT
jgi:hypothetical protein